MCVCVHRHETGQKGTYECLRQGGASVSALVCSSAQTSHNQEVGCELQEVVCECGPYEVDGVSVRGTWASFAEPDRTRSIQTSVPPVMTSSLTLRHTLTQLDPIAEDKGVACICMKAAPRGRMCECHFCSCALLSKCVCVCVCVCVTYASTYF